MSTEVQRQEREREDHRADTEKCNLNSEMTEQVETCGGPPVPPTAETRGRGRGSHVGGSSWPAQPLLDL